MLYVLLLCFPLAFGQASGTSEFNITLQFDWKYPVEKIKIYSFEKDGNYIEKLKWSIESKTNSITISGSTHYITGVDFPILVCSYDGIVYINNTPYEKNKLFYLLTNGFQSVATDEHFVFSENVGVIVIKRVQLEQGYKTVINTYPDLIFTPKECYSFTNATLRLK
ncbi:MAG: hypothetical protein RL607_793 [Bacteroidota bacterium]|jgi:hypothetical protein